MMLSNWIVQKSPYVLQDIVPFGAAAQKVSYTLELLFLDYHYRPTDQQMDRQSLFLSCVSATNQRRKKRKETEKRNKKEQGQIHGQ